MKRISRAKARELGFKNATEANSQLEGVYGYNKVKSIKRFEHGFILNNDRFIWSKDPVKREKQAVYQKLKADKNALNDWLKSINSGEEVMYHFDSKDDEYRAKMADRFDEIMEELEFDGLLL